jgi:hypothetical protein
MGLKKIPTSWFPYYADALPIDKRENEEGLTEKELKKKNRKKVFLPLDVKGNFDRYLFRVQ